MNAKCLASAATIFGAGLLTGWLVIPQPAPKAAGHDRKIPELVAKERAAEKEPPAPSLGMKNPADLARALSNPVSSHRRAALYRTLSELTPDNWQPLYDAFMERRKQGRHDQGDWELFLNALGAVDGQRAMTRLVRDMGNLKTSPPPDFHYILRTWVPANQEEALAWHESLPKGPFRDGLWSGYLGGLAEVDLDAAIKGVEAVDAQYRGYFLFDLAPRVFQNGGLAAGNAWLQTVIQTNENGTPEAQQHVRQVFREVSSRVIAANEAAGQPLESVKWMESHAEKPWFNQSTWNSAVASAVKTDPSAALAHISTLNSQLQSSALNSAITTWAGDDLPATEKWLAARQDTPFYDSAATGLINHLIKSDPPAAVRWIDSLSDPAARESMRRRVP